MDFTESEEHQALREAVAAITAGFGSRATGATDWPPSTAQHSLGLPRSY